MGIKGVSIFDNTRVNIKLIVLMNDDTYITFIKRYQVYECMLKCPVSAY